jgi:plasmid stability protein
MMPTMTLRDVPVELHAWLKQQARAHHRSVNKEAIVLLDRLRGEAPTVRQRITAEEIMAIACRVAQAPVLDDRSADEILGYDDNGLPR